LIHKRKKKSIRQLADASLEKLALDRLKSPILPPSKYYGAQTRTIFNCLSHLFCGSPDKVGRLFADNQSLGLYADNHKVYKEIRTIKQIVVHQTERDR